MRLGAQPLPQNRIEIVYILSVVPIPVSRDLICEFSGQDALAVQSVLDEWAQFLRFDPQKRHSLYHASFRDFLHRLDIVQAAGVRLEKINAAIADSLWDEYFSDAEPE